MGELEQETSKADPTKSVENRNIRWREEPIKLSLRAEAL
jgi:hypothetical protein